ncbi:uncharacterized protein LOC100906653 [Galendromus occidentalis]|uniref:Uncharacterized protein LOC100906653 n=1 Tax=Galendromus occidentalis TaxID=34638 RepID=A0AAJ7L6A0_9ACAR|nr:uncharacterized protein LOC100906653 [Galendromus occidentalis]
MWGGLNKAAAASLTRQQERFCSSIKDIDDKDQGWGELAEREESTEVGWGKSNGATPRSSNTGWGNKNTTFALRGWGAKRTPAPSPDLNSKSGGQTQLIETVEPRSPDLTLPKSIDPQMVNGRGSQQPVAGNAKTSVPHVIKQHIALTAGRLQKNTPAISSQSATVDPAWTVQRPPSSTGTERHSGRVETGMKGFPDTYNLPASRGNGIRIGSAQSKPLLNGRSPPVPPLQTQTGMTRLTEAQTAVRGTSASPTRATVSPPKAAVDTSASSVAYPHHRLGSPVVRQRVPPKAPAPKPDIMAMRENPNIHTRNRVRDADILPRSSHPGSRSVEHNRIDMFVVVRRQCERFAELIALLKDNRHRF